MNRVKKMALVLSSGMLFGIGLSACSDVFDALLFWL